MKRNPTLTMFLLPLVDRIAMELHCSIDKQKKWVCLDINIIESFSMYFQNEIIKCPYFSVLLFYSVLITTLYVLSHVLFIRCENTRKNKYDSCNANNSYSSFTAGNICDTVLLFFFFYQLLIWTILIALEALRVHQHWELEVTLLLVHSLRCLLLFLNFLVFVLLLECHNLISLS